MRRGFLYGNDIGQSGSLGRVFVNDGPEDPENPGERAEQDSEALEHYARCVKIADPKKRFECELMLKKPTDYVRLESGEQITVAEYHKRAADKREAAAKKAAAKKAAAENKRKTFVVRALRSAKLPFNVEKNYRYALRYLSPQKVELYNVALYQFLGKADFSSSTEAHRVLSGLFDLNRKKEYKKNVLPWKNNTARAHQDDKPAPAPKEPSEADEIKKMLKKVNWKYVGGGVMVLLLVGLKMKKQNTQAKIAQSMRRPLYGVGGENLQGIDKGSAAKKWGNTAADWASGKSVLYIGGGLALAAAAAAGTYFVFSKKIKQNKAEQAENKSQFKGTAENFAARINGCWGWFGFGDDEKKLYNILREIQTKKTWRKVQEAYKILYNKTITKEFEYRLSISEREMVTHIISEMN